MGIYIFLTILVIIACALVILVVLVQNSKGGGLAANFTSAGQSMGVRKTADFLEKSTWTLGVAILILCLAATASIPRGQGAKESVIKSSIERAQDPNAIPVLPTQTPVQGQPDGGNE
ncbi:MAG TPA: preprotein translocase subunit SecG [Bacteroidales bacterium]|jgi:preprotein translocase subunit SecG|nr:preprotein translocase subunit SecG [Bacteroidales bacterium]HQG22197.1 preprotein translocase subunit SecG [Bacteroidales bacterium]HQI12673.1 preprotein translocase subunit SecG [Bacteroidales bacterium]HQJ14668.1 preprotein translocase subunit SecG [Bacteroidales bacterium]